MRKKILSLLLIATIVLTGCSTAKEGSYTTKVKTSNEPIRTSSQFGSGSVVTNVGSSKPSKSDTSAGQNSENNSKDKPNVWFINNANGIGWSAAFTSSMNATFDNDAYDYTFVDGQGSR